MLTRLWACAPLVVLLVSAQAKAGLFTATYDFTGQPGNQVSQPVVANPPDLTFSDITRGPGITAEMGMNSINSVGWSTSPTIDLNDYYEFTITPAAGVSLAIDQIATTFRRSATGPRTLELRDSRDAFASPFNIPLPLADTTTTVLVLFIFSDLDNLTSPITFRLYGYNSEDGSGTLQLGISSGENPNGVPAIAEISGETTPIVASVPEPGSLALLLLGGSLVVARRLRRVAH